MDYTFSYRLCEFIRTACKFSAHGFFFLGLFLNPALSIASEDWIILSPEHGRFSAKFPKDNENHHQSFRIHNDSIVYSSQSAGTRNVQGQRYPTLYSIKLDQTFGPAIRDAYLGNLIRRDLEEQIRLYKDKNGVAKNMNDALHFGNFPGGEVQIDFNDPQAGPQTLKFRILITDVGKIQQTVIGTTDQVKSDVTKDFFDTLELYNGYPKAKNDEQNAWQDITSPLRIFKITLPQENNIFMPKMPQIKNTDRTERLTARLYDPLWQENILINVDGYSVNKPINSQYVFQILDERYISRQGVIRHNGTCRHKKIDEVDTIQCQYPIKPVKNHDYMNIVRLKAQYFDKTVLIHQIIASDNFINSPLINSIVERTEFLAGPHQKLVE